MALGDGHVATLSRRRELYGTTVGDRARAVLPVLKVAHARLAQVGRGGLVAASYVLAGGFSRIPAVPRRAAVGG